MTDRPYYPLFLDLAGRRAVIVGGGKVSARKAETLLRHGAAVTVIAPEVSEEIDALAGAGRIVVIRRTYASDDIADAFLVIASTSAAAVNAQIAADCRERNVLVNVVDDPTLGDFIVPAVVESGSIQIAVSTGGRSPALARVVRRAIEETIGPDFAEMNDILGSLREGARRSPRLPADTDRKRFFDGLLSAGVRELLAANRRADAYALVARLCDEAGVPISDLVRAGLAA
jgi:precorrin-2 dehydrogenase/sirohydrochlorin ferrochelatase